MVPAQLLANDSGTGCPDWFLSLAGSPGWRLRVLVSALPLRLLWALPLPVSVSLWITKGLCIQFYSSKARKIRQQ